MFLFGTTGTILPYIITLIALWSGVLLGYGRVFTFKESTQPKKEIKVDFSTNQSSPLAIFADVSGIKHTSSENFSPDYYCVNHQSKILVWLWYLHEFINFDENRSELLHINVSLTRGPPVC